MIELSDELLMAYIDGQLDKPNEKVVREILERDDSQGSRVRRLQDSQAKFLDLFGALVRDGAAQFPARPAARSARPSRETQEASGMATAGVAALLLIIGASLGFTVAYYTGISQAGMGEEISMSMRPANWSEDIAELHAYFTPEALTTARDSQSNPDVVRFQLAKLSSQAVSLPDFSQSGLRFVRAQTLNYRGNRLMQLVYTGKSDPLVALYITAGDDDHPVSPGRFGDVQTMSWSQNGLRFLIAADMTQEALRALAAVTRSQLAKG
jgi:anti-sigma factor RsiW